MAGAWPFLLVATLAVATSGLLLLTGGRADTQALAARASGVRAGRRSLRVQWDAFVRGTRWGTRLTTKLTSAGIGLRSGDFVGIVVAGALAGYCAARMVVAPVAAPVGTALVVWGAFAWVRRKRSQRREQFVTQLPELARVLSNATSAGLAIRTAVEMAAAELDDPAGGELRRVAEELRLGQSIDVALENLEARMPSREVAVLIGTLIIQHRAGGSLVSALRDMATTLDARHDLRRELKTLMAGSVYTSYVVVAMGVGSLVVLNLIHPGAVHTMTSKLIGQAALVVAGLLYSLGFFLIKRTTRIAT
jgi:tight adherence protein B